MTTESKAITFTLTTRLNGVDYERIEQACGESIKMEWARARFKMYVRNGHCYADAVRYTLAWARNMVEQKIRRASHDTGYEPWKRPWSEYDLARLGRWEVVVDEAC